VRGIRISVDWSWLLILFLIIVGLTGSYRDQLDEPNSSSVPYVLAVLSAFGFFASILLHELGHAFVALRNGVGISSIQLWLFGGVARMDRDTDSPEAEFKIAIAGPMVTLAIFVVLCAAGIVATGPSDFWDATWIESSGSTSAAVAVITWLAFINALLLVFNLLPAFPMDGGRVVRAIAWRRTGNRNSATRFAGTLGRGFGYLFMAVGILLVFAGRPIDGIWLAFIGVMINGAARGAILQSAISSRIEGVRVADVMDAEPVAIPEECSVEEALDEYFLRYRWPWFPVVDAAQRFKGLLIRESADEIPELSRATARVAELLEPDPGSLHRDAAGDAARQRSAAPPWSADGGRRRWPSARRRHRGADWAGASRRRRRRLVNPDHFLGFSLYRIGFKCLTTTYW
jgi:Zn-dependent protease